MPAIRKCAACGEPTLISSVGIFKAIRPYQCSNCGEIVKLMPLAMLGMQLTVFIFLSLASLSWIMFFANEGVKIITLLYVYAFWFFMTISVFGVVYFKIKRHKDNPIIKGADDDGEINVRINQADSWIEGKSFIYGMLVPVGFVLVIIVFFALLAFVDSIFFK